MTTFFSKNKQSFVLFDFVFWLLLAVIFPVGGGNFSVLNIINVFIYFSGVYYLGELLLARIDAIQQVPFLFRSGICIIVGGVAAAIIFLIVPSAIVVYGLAAIFILDLFFSKRIVVAFSFKNFLCLLPFFVILFQTYELAYATMERYSHNDGDYFFYTAIVESIKANHSLNNAVYHSGIPINYMVAPFLAPAQLASFAGISAQFALWGVYGKIIPVACLGTVTYTIVKLYENLFRPNSTKNSVEKKQFLVALMLLFLGPLHFLKLLKLDFKNTLFWGEGYLLPTGSPGFAFSMFFAGLVLLLVFSKEKYTVADKTGLLFFLCVISASKLALFLPLGALLGTMSVLWLLKKKPDLFVTLLIALPFCIVVYKLTVGGKNSIYAPLQFTKSGYYSYYFSELAGKYGISGKNFKKVFIMTAISVVMWLSIKMLILLVAFFNLRSNYRASSFIAASIIGLVISALPGFFILTYEKDSLGVTLFDDSFNMAQFVRGGIFLLTITALVFALYLLFETKNPWFRKIGLPILCAWMLIISVGFFSNDYTRAALPDQTWYKEVQQDFTKQKPALMAMMGSDHFSGQTLSNAGVHPWYCTGTRGDGEGCIFTINAYNRNVFFRKMFDPSIALSVRKSVADSIRKQGVDYIVGSPTSMDKINVAQKDSLVSAVDGAKWLYRLN